MSSALNLTLPLKYSQYDEEKYILQYSPQRGRFLDLGSYHPKVFSNTRALYELGWTGVMVEPSPLPFDSLLREYGNDERITLICAAVGIEGGMIKIHATADALSTSNEKSFEIWKKDGGFYGSFLTPCLRLRDLFQQFGGDFDFVNFDAEGVSVDLFANMLEIGPRPKVVCVEIDDRMGELASMATANGYKIVYANGTNAIMIL